MGKALPFPLIGLGTFELTGALCERVVGEALALGYRHIDTAQAYDNEVEIGAALKRSAVPLSEIFLSTKVWPDHLVHDLNGCVCRSLERLQVERLDLLLLHWPSPTLALERTMDALMRAQERGFTRLIGVCNFPLAELRAAQRVAHVTCDQVEAHPFLPQSTLARGASALGVPLVAYSPLARGRVANHPRFRALARVREATPAQVGLAWLLARGIAVIPKTQDPVRLAENLAAASVRLGPRELLAIDRLAQPRRIFDPPFAPEWDP